MMKPDRKRPLPLRQRELILIECGKVFFLESPTENGAGRPSAAHPDIILPVRRDLGGRWEVSARFARR
jgi:hypothetical protein